MAVFIAFKVVESFWVEYFYWSVCCLTPSNIKRLEVFTAVQIQVEFFPAVTLSQLRRTQPESQQDKLTGNEKLQLSVNENDFFGGITSVRILPGTPVILSQILSCFRPV